MKNLVLVLLVGILAFFLIPTTSADDPGSEKLRTFMRAKLKHSQAVVDGLVNEDFLSLAKNGQQLSLMSLESSWEVFQTEKYLQHSAEFRRAADALSKAAKDENIDGATLAYVDMTMSCVACHKYVRRVRMVSLPSDESLTVRTPK